MSDVDDTLSGAAVSSEAWSIGGVAAATGLSVHAIRFFEREGLLLRDIPRNAGRHRVFAPADLQWLTLVNRLRASGMPLARIRDFADLVQAGPGNERERLDLLEAHERAVRERIAELQDCLEIIEGKVATYHRHLLDGTVRGVWAPST